MVSTLTLEALNLKLIEIQAYLGQAELALDFLEYYGGRETEIIQLVLKDVPSGIVFIQLQYRLA